MDTIKIKFTGMGGNFDEKDNFITKILQERYVIRVEEDPDFLFYSVNSSDYLNYDCVRIFYTAENIVPDFNICDYAIGFHYLNFADRYIRYPLYLVDGFRAYAGDDYALNLQLALQKHVIEDDFLNRKTEFCSFVYSNAEAAECRRAMFDALSNYKRVNSAGRYLNNVGRPLENKLEFQKKHKFVIAFENTSTPGYTTEKIVHAFAAGAIPIYWGNPDIMREFNPESFINCHDFGLTEKGEQEIIAKIVEEVKRLDQDDKAYMEMLRTPAFTAENNVDMQRELFKKFLFHIFDQNIESAYRRNRFYWGERYERKQRIGNRFYWQCRKVIPIRDGIRKLFRRYK